MTFCNLFMEWLSYNYRWHRVYRPL